MTKQINTIKGMRDFSSSVMFRRNYIFSVIKTTFEKYGFSPIETPAMESLETLSGKYGDEGDKLIFKVLNSGDFLSKIELDDNITSNTLSKQISQKALRYDLTVPLARYVVKNRNDIIFPFKRYQIQNVWRADRPQKGRFREFFQCDADIIGTKSLISEIELIQLYDEIFSCLSIPNINICINNRKVLIGMVEVMNACSLFNEIVIILDKIDKIGLEEVKKEISLLGVKAESIEILDKFLSIKKITELKELLCSSKIGIQGIEELEFIFKNLENLGLKTSKLKFDITLARGIDYYTGCILEVKQKNINIGSLGGGGRYDDLTALFGLNDVSGVGVSFGVDRIYIVMEELNLFPLDIDKTIKVLIINFGEDEQIYCLDVLQKLRNEGISSELYPSIAKMKKQMNYADKRGVEYVLIIGEDEMVNGKVGVKEMSTGKQREMELSEFINEIK